LAKRPLNHLSRGFIVRQLAAFALVFGFTLATSVVANAQYFPPGSYQLSCRNITMTGSHLSASCTDPNGNYRFSRINVVRCGNAGIANINGQLRCGTGGGANVLPMGSYQASCGEVSMRGPILSARCTSPSGNRIFSSLDVRRCGGGNVRNQNGFLVCGAGSGY
jgi:hypothetical protein